MTGRYNVIGPDGELLARDVTGDEANEVAANAGVDAEIRQVPDVDELGELMTSREAADELGVTLERVQLAMRAGQVAAVRTPSGRWRIPVTSMPALRAVTG